MDKRLSNIFTLTQTHPFPPLSLHLPSPPFYPRPLLVINYGSEAANPAIILRSIIKHRVRRIETIN